MKKIIAIASVALAALIAHSAIVSRTIDATSDRKPVGIVGKVVSAHLGSVTNSGTFNLEIGRRFDFGSTIVSAQSVIFGGSYSSNVSNVVFTAPIYVSPVDTIRCYGTNATNGTAKAILFIEQ